MNPFRLLLLATAALSLNAQTNPPAAITNAEPAPDLTPEFLETNAPPHQLASPPQRAPTEVFSDSANFDLKSRIAVYIGHVLVVDPKMRLTCGIMTARVPESGKIDSIVAEQDVVIDAVDNEGRPIHATSDRAVYTYRVADSVTNETVVLTGNPEVKSRMFTGTGDAITWDRANNSVSATHPHMVIQPESQPFTNAPAPLAPPASTNTPAPLAAPGAESQ
jgi:lipopolysaccharide transport protein LptA